MTSLAKLLYSAVFLVVLTATASNAKYFYAGDYLYTNQPEIAPRLFLFDTETGQYNVIGQLKDSEGNRFRATVLYYHEDSQRLFGFQTPLLEEHDSYMFEVNPNTAEGKFWGIRRFPCLTVFN